MKAFGKISASRVPTNEESVDVGGLYFNKSEIFTADDIDEITEFVSTKFPELLGGNTFYINSFPHLFGGSVLASKRFIYVLSCLRDGKGQPLFKLSDEDGLFVISIVSPHVIKTDKDKKPTKSIKESEVSESAPEAKTKKKRKSGKKDNKEIVDTLKGKFNLGELREIVNKIDGIEKRYVGKMKETKLVGLIIENKSKEEIKGLIGL